MCVLQAYIRKCRPMKLCHYSIMPPKLKEVEETKLSEKYLFYPIRVLNILGLWRMDNNPFLYYTYAIILIVIMEYCYTTFQIIYVVYVWGDIEEFAEGTFIMLTQASFCTKLILFTWKRSKLKRLVKEMDDELFNPKIKSHHLIINRSVLRQKIEYFLFVSTCFCCIILFVILPLIDSRDKVLPFKAWYPIPNDVSPYYELIFTYQITGIWISALINMSLDRLFTAMIACGCAQVEILIDKLINLEKYTIDEIINERKSEKVLYDTKIEDSLLKDRVINNLNKCIQLHQFIVRFIAGVEDCFTKVILTQFTASVGIICITALQLTVINIESSVEMFISKILYFMAMMFQIIFICRIGNDITSISTAIPEALYFSPWLNQDRRYKTTLLIFRERLKRPIITRAGSLFPLSYHTLIAMLRSSYSYFTVLQQLNTK